MASSNPTTGLTVAAQIALSGTGVTHTTPGNTSVRQYAVNLSLSGTNTVALTATVQDVAGTTVVPSNSIIWKSYETGVATVSAGTVTGVTKGQAIIEAQLPTFDNTEGTGAQTGDPTDMIYVQILVTVGV